VSLAGIGACTITPAASSGPAFDAVAVVVTSDWNVASG
jgi:hypothetical protein